MVSTKNIKPLVSVVITNYNYEEFISEAIESVLNQTYKDLELIIIDDGSTDLSRNAIDSSIEGHSNAKLIPQKNKGVVQARNKGIDISLGEYILFVDGDDMIPNDYIEALVEDAERLSLDVAYTDYERFGDERGESEFPDFSFDKLRVHNFIHVSALIRKSAIDDARFDPYLSRLSHEDWDFYLNLAFRNVKFGKVGSVRLKYRSHGGSRNLNIDNGNYIEDALRFVKAHVYIMDKYNRLYPGSIELTPESELVLRWAWSNERYDTISKLEGTIQHSIKEVEIRDKLIAEKDDTVVSLCKDIEDIRSSHRYRVGSIIAKPVEYFKKLIDGGSN